MSNLQSLIDNVGEDEFRLITEDRIRDAYNTDIRQDPEYGRPLTLEEARQFSEVINEDRSFGVAPAQFANDRVFFETFEDLSEWGMDVYDIEVMFGGTMGEDGYIDTVYVIYEDVVGRGMTGQAGNEFEQSILKKFAKQLSVHPDENRGLCAFCNPNVEVKSVRDEDVIRPPDDVLGEPQEIDFYEFPHYGRGARLWFEE